MAAEVLVESDIDIGQEAGEALKASGVPVRALFWLYLDDADRWRLFVATPLVDLHGPQNAYQCIDKAIDAAQLADRLPLERIGAISPKDWLVRALRRYVRTGSGRTGIRIRNSLIDGGYVEDAYVYRIR